MAIANGHSRGTRGRAVEIGEEPPLLADGTNAPLRDRRAVSGRWLVGTVLTGVTSLVLMGGALIVALDDHISVAAPIADADPHTADAEAGRSRKADRYQPEIEAVTNRQVIQVSTVTRQGDRDLIRVRPFARVTASLELKPSATQVEIPPFDPLAIFADGSVFSAETGTDAIYGAQVEGEVTVATRDFPVGSALIDPDLTLSVAEVEAVVRDENRFASSEPVEFVNAPSIDPARFDFAMADPLALSDLAVRIVPENVSEIAKTDEPAAAGGAGDPAATPADALAAETMVTAKKRETLAKLLAANSVEEPVVDTLVARFADDLGIRDLSAGDKVRIAYGPHPDGGDGTQVLRVSLYRDDAHRGTIALNDAGAYVAAAEPVGELPAVPLGAEDAGEEAVVAGGGGLTLYESLYQTAHAQEIPENLVGEMIRMFSFDVDFNSRARPGDKLEVFYALDEDGQPMATPEVLYAALTVGDSERRLYRFRAQDDGTVDYYDDAGKSAQKFLMRKPMSVGTFRSGFGMRRHPILGWVKAHTGVDWAARTGTPIVASGNGTVEEAEWKSGYGRWVLIRHANGYQTGYGHMSGIAKGIKPGVKVRQGQVVGFVGSTGLSTGPHLHYEVHINGRPVDPLRIRLPRGRELGGDMLTAFERERERIDTLLGRTAPLPAKVAQTN